MPDQASSLKWFLKICLHLHSNGIHYKSLIIKKWRWFSRPVHTSGLLCSLVFLSHWCHQVVGMQNIRWVSLPTINFHQIHLFNTITALTSESVTVWIVVLRTKTSLPYLCHCHWHTEEACSCRCCWSSGCDGWGWTSPGFWRPRCLQQVLWRGLVTWRGQSKWQDLDVENMPSGRAPLGREICL